MNGSGPWPFASFQIPRGPTFGPCSTCEGFRIWSPESFLPGARSQATQAASRGRHRKTSTPSAVRCRWLAATRLLRTGHSCLLRLFRAQRIPGVFGDGIGTELAAVFGGQVVERQYSDQRAVQRRSGGAAGGTATAASICVTSRGNRKRRPCTVPIMCRAPPLPPSALIWLLGAMSDMICPPQVQVKASSRETMLWPLGPRGSSRPKVSGSRGKGMALLCLSRHGGSTVKLSSCRRLVPAGTTARRARYAWTGKGGGATISPGSSSAVPGSGQIAARAVAETRTSPATALRDRASILPM